MDSHFWNSHYQKFDEQAATPFCEQVGSLQIRDDDFVYELGCGNGRDALRLTDLAAKYVGLDMSVEAISATESRLASAGSLGRGSARVCDFTSVDWQGLCSEGIKESGRLVLYSRFSLHSITALQEDSLFSTIQSFESAPVLLLVEARTVFDELFGEGTEVERNAFVSDHFRRFLDPEEFRERVNTQMKVEYFEVSRGFAKYKAEDPQVLRMVATSE